MSQRGPKMGNCKSKKQNVDPEPDNQMQQTSKPYQHQNGNNGTHNYEQFHSRSELDNEVTESITASCNKINLNSNISSSGPNGRLTHDKSQSASSPHGFKSAGKQQNNISPNQAVIESTRMELGNLLEGINQFTGTSQDDKDYRYYDEMLTRCILNLDQIECRNSLDRSNRREAIHGVNEAINILERKLAINTEIENLESDLKK